MPKKRLGTILGGSRSAVAVRAVRTMRRTSFTQFSALSCSTVPWCCLNSTVPCW